MSDLNRWMHFLYTPTEASSALWMPDLGHISGTPPEPLDLEKLS